MINMTFRHYSEILKHTFFHLGGTCLTRLLSFFSCTLMFVLVYDIVVADDRLRLAKKLYPLFRC